MQENRMERLLKNTSIFIILTFLVYGIFLPQLPTISSDELWETSRAYYLKTEHKPGDPLAPESVAPYYSAASNLGWKSWCIFTLKTGTFASMMYILPVDPVYAMRYGMLLWSILACVFTFLIARALHLNYWYSILCVAFLVSLPEFFSQVHRERSEIMICASLLGFVYFFIKTMGSSAGTMHLVKLIILGFTSWLPSILIHPSGIIIPVVIGVLYLYFEREGLFTLKTVLIGFSLLIGFLFFLEIMDSMKQYAIEAGGGNYFLVKGPPVIIKGWKYIVTLPITFYNKFYAANVLARPVSFIIYSVAIILIALQTFNKKIIVQEKLDFVLIAVSAMVSLFILYLFSGSYGNYNVIAAPFFMILFVKYIERNSKLAIPTRRFSVITSFVLLIVFSVNGLSLGRDFKMAQEYSFLKSRVRKKIPQKVNVLGSAIYYDSFKDQNYYSTSWFDPNSGKVGQSFKVAVEALNVKYVIIDDAFVSRAFSDRGEQWTDSMLSYLDFSGQVVDEFDANYFINNPATSVSSLPKKWRYPNQVEGYIHKVKVYKLD